MPCIRVAQATRRGDRTCVAWHPTALRNIPDSGGRLTHEDVSRDWADATGTTADAVVDRVMLADMVVLHRRRDATGYPDMVEAASHILMRALR